MSLTGMVLLGLAFVVLGLVLLDMYRRMQRTEIFQVAGGLRFESYHFAVQVQRQQQELRVRCARGLLQKPAVSGAEPVPALPGFVEHTFAAVGFSMELRASIRQRSAEDEPVPTGGFDIVMRGADGTQLTIAHMNARVAEGFRYFYLQVRIWIDKLEQRIERERVARLREEEDAALARRDADLMAQLQEGKVANAPLTDAEREAMAAAQIAQWRNAAGFEGQHSMYHTDTKGRVVWFVDLADDGRITLHADRCTVHGTLRGASIESIYGELEVGVRDAYWTEAEPELRTFRVLRGRNAQERRAWKERLEILRNSLPP